MTEIEIGRAKRGRRAYSFDDIAIVPVAAHPRPRGGQRRLADRRLPVRAPDPGRADGLGDVARRPRSRSGKYGGLGVLNLEGLWTRYDDPSRPARRGRRARRASRRPRRLQEIYAEPIKAELITARLQRDARRRGHRRRLACRPQRTKEFAKTVVDAGVDMFVIRGTTVSAEHVSSQAEPLNLKEFIYELDVPVIVGGCATYQAALHLMRTGAAGVLVGFGGGAAHTTRTVLGVAVPMASAVADVAAARRDYLDESGGRYVHVIADGSIGRVRRHRQGDRLRRRRGDGRLAVRPRHRRPGPRLPLGRRGAPRRRCPRGERVEIGTVGTLEEILFGPSRVADGTMNLVGALRRAMATTGYTELKEFQRVEVVVVD